MKKIFWIICCGFICIQLAGCSGWAIRTSSSSQPRVDQEVSGNRGFLSGKPVSEPKEPTFTERKVYKIEIEVPELIQKRESGPKKRGFVARAPKEDKVVWGNRGYIFAGPKGKAVEEAPGIYVPEETRVEEPSVVEIEEEMPRMPKIQMRTYKVKKGDTLQKISAKFYGTTKKWLSLYKANKDKLKGPDKIRPGQTLVIPEAAEFKK